MPPNTPHALVPLLREPLVSEMLCVKVVDFIRAVVHMRTGASRYEESVVVHIVLTSVQMCKDSDDMLLAIRSRDVKDVRWNYIEMLSIPFNLLVEQRCNQAVMADLGGS
jgi:hypothetical protein